MKYLNEQTKELLTNNDFIEWVVNPTSENEIFWTRWIDNHPEKKPAVDEAIFIIKSVYFSPRGKATLNQNSILNNILKEHYSSRNSGDDNTRGVDWYGFIKVAAVILLLLGVGLYTYITNSRKPEQPVIVEQKSKFAPEGKKLTFYLPDSTRVTLNSDSRLFYPASFANSKSRKVTLLGEAYFDVHHNPEKTFYVNTEDITTAALGTTFNIQAYPGASHISVALISGKVQVTNTGISTDQNVLLSPGNKYVYDKNTEGVSYQVFKTEDEIAWKEGILIFKKDNIETFIAKIEKWYGVDVKVKGQPKEAWKVTGRFNNHSLELLLESVQYIQDIKYSIEDKNVLIQF